MAIDRALAHAEPLAAIGRRYGVTVSALGRRRATLMREHRTYLTAMSRLPKETTP